MPRMRSVLSRAGCPELLSNVSPDILSLAKGVYAEALGVAVPRAVSWSLAGDDLPAELTPPELEGFRSYTVISATLGDALDEKIAERFAAGAPLEATLYDAWGSEAVETLVDNVDRRLRAENGDGSVRFAPGYGGFDVRNNARWLDLLAANGESDAGVTANRETGILSPRKSVLCMIGWKG